MMDLFRKAVAGDAVAIRAIKNSSIQKPGAVEVRPSEIIEVLNGYLDGKKTASELQAWADLLVSHEAFVGPNWDEDDEADKYEPMWYILQQISTPFIDGELNAARAQDFIKNLKSID